MSGGGKLTVGNVCKGDERRMLSAANGLNSQDITAIYDNEGRQIGSCWTVTLPALRDQIDALIRASGGGDKHMEIGAKTERKAPNPNAKSAFG